MNEQQFKQLKIIYSEYDKVWLYCPFHKDTIRPNLSISLLDKYYGRYKCWACPAEGRLSKVQMKELNLSKFITYKSNRKKLDTRWQMFNKSCYNNLQKFPLLKLGLAKQLNVSTQSLDDWEVGCDRQSFTIPMIREDLEEYTRENGFCGTQRRFADGTKRCVIGSHLGLMYSYYSGDCYTFICEGFSDAISVYEMGLESIARPHCRYTDGIEAFFTQFRADTNNIIIIPDNDSVGREGGDRLKGILELDYDVSVFSFDGAKDIRQLIQLKGRDYVKRELEKYIS